MRQAGRILPSYLELKKNYSFDELMQDKKLAAKVTLLPINDLGVDAGILFSDILVIPKALGLQLEFTNLGPKFNNALNHDIDTKNLSFDPTKLEYIYNNIKEIKKQRPDTPLIGFCGGPLTTLLFMFRRNEVKKDFTEVIKLFYKEKEKCLNLMEMITEASLEYTRNQIKSGIDCFQLFETYCGIIPQEMYTELVLPFSKKILNVAMEGNCKTIFFPKNYNSLNSMNNGEHYVSLENSELGQELNIYKYKDGERVRTLFKSDEFDLKRITNYSFSNDEKKLLFETQSEKIYRYSSRSIYYVYNIFTDKLKKISDDKLMFATFSPAGNKIAYVLDNNIYIHEINSGRTKQVTFDGQKNQIINGASDWVYEEEFGLVRSFEWAPDGEHIAYYKFDETNVKEFSMDLFKGGLYPTQEVFKYPKAGEENSVVRIYFYNLKKDKSTYIYTEKDYEYIPRIKWTKNSNILALYGMNRHQNELDFVLADATSNTNRVLFTEKDNYYIDIHDNLTFLPDDNFIWTSEKDGFNHIYIKGLDGSEQQITKGNWEVTSFDGVDSDKMELYYRSTEEGSINRTLYVHNLFTGKKRKLSTQIGDN